MPKIHKEPIKVQKAKFLAAYTNSRGILQPALNACQLSYHTYMKWFKEDEAFRKDCVDVERMQVDFVESKLLDLVAEGNPTAIIFYLKCRRHEKWNDKSNAQVNIASTGNITFQIGASTDTNSLELLPPSDEINLLEE